jgi:protein-tyrosine phosphatase
MGPAYLEENSGIRRHQIRPVHRPISSMIVQQLDTPVAATGLIQSRLSALAVMRARAALRVIYHAARNLPDRILHPRRHLAVCRRLSRMARPRSILVVCYGNVCRSPYLDAVLQRALPDTAVSSAGFVGRDRFVPIQSLELSAQRGIDLSHFRSRTMSPEIVRGAELIVVMDNGQARYIQRVFRVSSGRLVVAGDLDPANSPTRAIRDPWMQSVDVFASSFDRLDRCAATLVRVLNNKNGN